MKKFISTNAIAIIIASVFLLGYTASLQLPVYADSNTDNWLNVTTNEELAEAFRYYCKSRDLTIEGSVADAVTTFTTKTFNGICNTLGIDVTALQAQIKYQTDGNVGKRFLFTTLGIDAYNRIFAQFLQDNNLNVGDEYDDEVIDTSIVWTDDAGNSCSAFVFAGTEMNASSASGFNTAYNSLVNVSGNLMPSYVKYIGSYYLQNGTGLSSLYESGTYSISVPAPISKTCSITRVKSKYDKFNNLYYYFDSSNTTGFVDGYMDVYRNSNQNQEDLVQRTTFNGYPCIVYIEKYSSFYFCTYSYHYATGNNENYEKAGFRCIQKITDTPSNSEIVNIYVTTNNNTINNNNYEGDTIINNEGDIINNNGDDDTPNYDPYPDGGGTNTPSGNVGGDGSDGTINFPNFNLNLPEINWSLGDLSNKFPFSIPFDMIAFLTLLNGEPQAPHITGSIPLTSHYTWELDLDFSEFDTFAGIMRGLEFVGFMFFLISATINIVRG